MTLQLSVFLQNKSGKIAAITQALWQANVDIRALTIADTTDFGILRMLVSDVDQAKEALRRMNCVVSTNEVVVLAVPDVTGGLSELLTLLARENVDIEYMYSLVVRGSSDAYMVLRVCDETRLLQVLERSGIRTVSPETLQIKM